MTYQVEKAVEILRAPPKPTGKKKRKLDREDSWVFIHEPNAKHSGIPAVLLSLYSKPTCWAKAVEGYKVRTACGNLRCSFVTNLNPKAVTCKACLKLIEPEDQTDWDEYWSDRAHRSEPTRRLITADEETRCTHQFNIPAHQPLDALIKSPRALYRGLKTLSIKWGTTKQS